MHANSEVTNEYQATLIMLAVIITYFAMLAGVIYAVFPSSIYRSPAAAMVVCPEINPTQPNCKVQ